MSYLVALVVAIVVAIVAAALVRRRADRQRSERYSLWQAEIDAGRDRAIGDADEAASPHLLEKIMRAAYDAAMRARADGIHPGPDLMKRAQDEWAAFIKAS